MAKVCNYNDCSYPVFGGGYCRNHQWNRERKPKKFKPFSPIKRSPIRYSKEPTGEAVLFNTIWNTRNKKSYLSGKKLDKYYGTDLFFNLFAHLLSKAQNRYPKYKLNEKNIVLLTPAEHLLLDQGTEDARSKYGKENKCAWEKVYTLRRELEREYVDVYGGELRYQ